MDNFADQLIAWYAQHKRDLPWRHTTDPYKIWLSEVILHQTRVAQGLPYYERYLSHYPDIKSLAAATEDEVLRHWQGLGYYSRARNMHKTARQIVELYDGKFPDAAENLAKLKGIGPYTTAAIGSFAFNLPLAVVDGNVKRVIARYAGVELPIDSKAGHECITELATAWLPAERSAIYNQAIMEFGALQCVPKNPNCEVCVFENSCAARKMNKVQMLPLKSKSIIKRNRFFNYIALVCNDKLYLHKRQPGDIWEGLYEFLLVEDDKLLELNEIGNFLAHRQKKMYGDLSIFNNFKIPFQWRQLGDFKHVLTHQLIHARFFAVEIDEESGCNSNQLFSKEMVEKLPKPILIERIFKKHF